jgi:hypothetical protein
MFYNIKISYLGPHNIQITLFVVLCENYLNFPPYSPLCFSIFHGRATRVSKSNLSLIAKGPLEAPDEQRARQTTPPETHVSLQRPIGDVLKATEHAQLAVKTVPVVK